MLTSFLILCLLVAISWIVYSSRKHKQHIKSLLQEAEDKIALAALRPIKGGQESAFQPSAFQNNAFQVGPARHHGGGGRSRRGRVQLNWSKRRELAYRHIN